MRASTVLRKPAGPHPSPADSPRSPLLGALAVFAAAAVLHVGVVLVVHQQTHGVAQFPDARGYDAASTTLVAAWNRGIEFGTTEMANWSGSQLWGYEALMALGKTMTGGGWLEAKMLLALMAASGAAAAYGLGIASGCGRKRAVIAGFVVGVSPNLLLWDAWGLKEGLITSLVLWTLLLQARARFTLACVGTLLSIQACLYMRPPTALFLAVALLVRARLRRTHLVGWLIIAGAAAVFVVPRATILLSFVDHLEVAAGVPLEFKGGYGSRNLLTNPQYFAVCIFDPFPWSFEAETAGPTRWLCLGTIIWIASLALASVSLRKAWADTTGIGRPVVLASIFYAVTYIVTFGATFYRQRSLLECMLIILVALYLPLSPAAAMMRIHVWLAVVACVAVVHSPHLTPTMWSKWLAVCVMSLAVSLAFMSSLRRGVALRLRDRRT